MTNKELINSSIYDKLPYRTILDMEYERKFGLEIEMALSKEDERYYLYNQSLINRNWRSKHECTISEGISCELVSPPLRNTKDIWDCLKKLGVRMSQCKLDFYDASFQVNMDINYDEKAMINFLKIYAIYEDVLYRLSRSDKKELRTYIKLYSTSIRNLTIKNSFEKAIKEVRIVKNYAIHLQSYNNGKSSMSGVPNVIEFRSPNGTHNYNMWQNYINVFYYLIKVAENGCFDEDRIDYLFDKLKPLEDGKYDVLNVEKAIDFANIIFDKDIDKLYFLKYYIGNDNYNVAKSYHLKCK